MWVVGFSLKGGSIPIFDAGKVRDRPALAEMQRRCDAGKPLGMFRSTETEFLLIYDCELDLCLAGDKDAEDLWLAFGIYVDRYVCF
jgi:hypothetical protein